MNILFHLNYPAGLGADRWIAEGYRDAFGDLGHSCAFLTERDDPQSVLAQMRPDIFFTSTNFFEKGAALPRVIREYQKKYPCKVFFHVGEDFLRHEQALRSLAEADMIQVWYSFYAPEVMRGFSERIGKKLYFVPLAANKKLHFPVPPDPRFRADISFIGARLPAKEHIFQAVLLPLARISRVRIYGPGWTMKDKVLRTVSALARRTRRFSLAKWIDTRRMAVAPEEERVIYSSSAICINIHEYSPNGVSKNLSNEREFKIPACGGFQVSDTILGLDRVFTPGKEIIVVGEISNWIPTVLYYLKHGEERRRIQAQGRARVENEHTYHHRAKQLLNLHENL